jgi:hypothetical protein
MKTVLKRVALFLREIGNLLSNILVPLVSLIIAIMELFPIPMGWIKIAKKVEHWLFYAYGTSKKIEEIIEDKAK